MADTQDRYVLQEDDVQRLLETLKSLRNTIAEGKQTFKKGMADVREGLANVREGLTDMRKALRLTVEVLHDTKVDVDIDSTNERESHEATESSYTVTHCVPQSQVSNSIMEHSHRFCSRSLDVCEDLPYAYAIVGSDQVQFQSDFECVTGKDNAYHMFDKENYTFQQKQKLSLFPKSWKFKFKGEFEAEFCSESHSGLDFDVGVTTNISMDKENCNSGVKKSYMKHKWMFKYKFNTWFSEELRFWRENIYDKLQVWHRWKNKTKSMYAVFFLVGVDKQQSSFLLQSNQIWDPGGIFLQLKLQGVFSLNYINLEVKVFQTGEI